MEPLDEMGTGTRTGREPPAGSQALLRALDVLEAVAEAPADLSRLAQTVGLSRSTAHRLASSLVARDYLGFAPGKGYTLGPKLLELGQRAVAQRPLVQIARPFLERLAEETGDTVHLGILEGDWTFYLDKIPGRRRFEVSSRVGERQPVWSTGLGKALIIDADAARLDHYFGLGSARGPSRVSDKADWLARMRDYAGRGCAFDLEENEPDVRCVAAPVRDASGAIVAAVSLSSLSPYMHDERMEALARAVMAVAETIGRELGWRPR